MAKKKRQVIPLPNDVGHDFDDDYNVLNFRPNVDFVSPEKIYSEPGPDAFQEDGISDAKNQVEALIANFDAIAELADIAQDRLDDRVKSLGGFGVKLDPVVDAAVIAAMKRAFPNDPDPTTIDYDHYKECLKRTIASARPAPTISAEEMRKAQDNQYKTNFGALGMANGEARPEISSNAQSISPIDMSAFQAAAVIALFALLLPLITQFVLQQIATHYAMPGHTV